MSWTQAYQAQFAKPLVNQLIAMIQRDQAAALAVINAARATDGNAPLGPITEFHKGPGARTGWPWLSLEIGPTNFNRGDDKATRHHEVRINLALDTGQYDQEMAQEDAQDYARLLDMIITSAGPWPSLGDWTTSLPIQHETVSGGTTAPNAVGTVNEVFVESHVPGQVSAPGIDVPIMRITLTVLFELEET
ncbi:MAG: hypothetical protein ABSA59_02590 [Terriglobia bacterium]|jgi:hypothetical protein